MLTFLRKIRKNLIESGSVRKYLIYAIGEIILVMIGILLALQVNNWNIDRISGVQEKHYLQRIVQDLNLDLLEIEEVVESNHYRLYQAKSILDFMGEGQIFDEMEIYKKVLNADIDTLNVLKRPFGNGLVAIRYYDSFDRTDITFQELLANGKIDNVQNESLKIAILNHYSQLDDKLQLVSMTETMRNEYVHMLVDNGISMFYDESYEHFAKNYPESEHLVAQIKNIIYITQASQRILRYNENSIEKETKGLIHQIESYLK